MHGWVKLLKRDMDLMHIETRQYILSNKSVQVACEAISAYYYVAKQWKDSAGNNAGVITAMWQTTSCLDSVK